MICCNSSTGEMFSFTKFISVIILSYMPDYSFVDYSCILIHMMNEIGVTRIFQRVETLRRANRLTQTTLGQVLGVSQATMSKKLRGEIPFSACEVQSCARHFRVSTDYLYGLTDDPAPVLNGEVVCQ
ncbi:helix-turn-helix domain-containing protein [Bifidobacterium bifidum]|uniref:helix-turn-helix domain-containing protein n=2 Tax=Bifidobacterium bifidum TaxID=1681 RepID=UPI0009BFD580